VQVLRPVKVAVVVVEDIHVFQLLRSDYLFFEKGSDETVSEGGQGLRDRFCYFEVDDCDFFAFGVFVDPCEVIDAGQFKGKLGENAIDFFLKVGEEGGQSLTGGVVTQDKLEECKVGKFVAVLSE
jgi:hypothetical protein